jgi:hypothetical protein
LTPAGPAQHRADMDQFTSPLKPGSDRERQAWLELQSRLGPMFRDVYIDPAAPRTIVVVPSLSLDPETLAKVSGVRHYEERQLSMLMWLRLPNTRVVYVTSEPLDPVIVDYYLSLLDGVPGLHARRRLVLLSAYDATLVTLTRKILDRPRLIQRIRQAVGDPAHAHLSVFHATAEELTLSVQLGIPLYACDPAHAGLGSKSGSRKLFRAVGVPCPDGHEDLRDSADIATAIAALKQRNPQLTRAVVKFNDGFSGEGNAVFDYAPDDPQPLTGAWVELELWRRLKPEAPDLKYTRYLERFEEQGGIVEAWVDGRWKRSPSVQLRITPTGALELISTHDQVLGGRTGQVFQGSTFPADPAYACDLHDYGMRVGLALRERGAMGRFAVDFVSVPTDQGWKHVAIEINLRKGGTTLPYHMLQFMTGGSYDAATARFRTPAGQERAYYATDNLVNPAYRRLSPEDLIDVMVGEGLLFNPHRETGVVFNLIGALSEFGKLGVIAIDADVQSAEALYRRTVDVLDRATLGD